jgi:hypothetical protein
VVETGHDGGRRGVDRTVVHDDPLDGVVIAELVRAVRPQLGVDGEVPIAVTSELRLAPFNVRLQGSGVAPRRLGFLSGLV